MKKRLPGKKHNPQKAQQTTESILIKPSVIAYTLGAIALALVLVSVTGQYLTHMTDFDKNFWLIPLMNVDLELSVPTVYSVLLLFCAFVLLAIITILKERQKDKYLYKWGILAAGFLFMAFDEGSSFHELMISVVYEEVGRSNLPGAFYFGWVIPGIVIVVVLGTYFSKFILALPKKTKRNFIIAAAVYLIGALGMEMTGGNYEKFNGPDNFPYTLIVAIEEGLEFTGMIVFIYALLDYIAEMYKEVPVRFSRRG